MASLGNSAPLRCESHDWHSGCKSSPLVNSVAGKWVAVASLVTAQRHNMQEAQLPIGITDVDCIAQLQ